MTIKKTVVMVREYEDGKLIYRETKITKTDDRKESEKDTKFKIDGLKGGD